MLWAVLLLQLTRIRKPHALLILTWFADTLPVETQVPAVPLHSQSINSSPKPEPVCDHYTTHNLPKSKVGDDRDATLRLDAPDPSVVSQLNGAPNPVIIQCGDVSPSDTFSEMHCKQADSITSPASEQDARAVLRSYNKLFNGRSSSGTV